MIDDHSNSIAAYCEPEDKVTLDFVEGLDNKIRAFQCRALGLRDGEYLRIKILTYMLPLCNRHPNGPWLHFLPTRFHEEPVFKIEATELGHDQRGGLNVDGLPRALRRRYN
jgi:hypothetical protein